MTHGRINRTTSYHLALTALWLFFTAAILSAAPYPNGTFRFLTQSLPVGSKNTEYVARLLTANADGPVTFSVLGLPPGLELDSQSGWITGRPTDASNYADVEFTANDGTNTITLTVDMSINSSGGGGNAGVTFTNVLLADARVGTPYTETITLSNGVGPYIFGGSSLPPGLSLNGTTGVISGTPIQAGTYNVNLTAVDFGESNKVVTVLPLTVLPETSDFRFTTYLLNNGEVGTAYYDLWTTSGGVGTVTYSASGLPAGLSVAADTGIVSGTPTAAGTFLVSASASDSHHTISITLSMVIVPSSTSEFYWDFFGIPAGLVNVSYDRMPPILVAAVNGTTVSYSAVGLPSGISYNTSTGELTGTASEVGEYPVVFTATDSATSQTIQLAIDFIVLPPNGGDTGKLAVNFWVTNEQLKTGAPLSAMWKGKAIFNADRRTGYRFNWETNSVLLNIGSRTITVPAGMFVGTTNKYVYKSETGATPVESVGLSLASQTLQWSSTRDTLAESVPGAFRQVMVIGTRSYRIEQFFSEKGLSRPTFDFRKTAFVVSSGKIAVSGAGSDTASLSLLLADPTFVYEPGVTALKFRLLSGSTVLVDKTFTELGTAKISTDASRGTAVYSMKTLKDPETETALKKFNYNSKTGKMSISLAGLTLAAIPASEAHLGVELTVGDASYYTSVTFFAPTAGKYSTKMP